MTNFDIAVAITEYAMDREADIATIADRAGIIEMLEEDMDSRSAQESTDKALAQICDTVEYAEAFVSYEKVKESELRDIKRLVSDCVLYLARECSVEIVKSQDYYLDI